MRIGILIWACMLAGTAGCVASPDYGATRFACSDGVCPSGFDCIEAVCIAEGEETPPDASVVVVDAALPDAALPDAQPQATCDEMFSTAPGYELCSEDEESCSFNVALGGDTCTSACLALNTTCLGAFDNNEVPCIAVPETGDTCDTVRGSNICVCARIPETSS